MKKLIALMLVILLTLGGFSMARADWSDDWGTYNPNASGSSSTTYGQSRTVTSNTSLYSATTAQLTNINLAAGKLASVYVNYGQTFSFNTLVGPRTSEYGYKLAVNGRGARVRGGGVGQVATTLYLALKQINNIEYTEFRAYEDNFTERYVSNGDDAVVTDYAANMDFAFINRAGDMHIEMWVSRSYVNCTITLTNGGGSSEIGTQIGYISLPLSGTNTLKNNVRLAAEAINGTQLSYYNEFSFNQIVGPRTARYGYGDAINGRGVKVSGGGVAQVASAVYMAVKKLDNVKITELRTYEKNYNQSYVASADDAVVTDYNGGLDFAFQYKGHGLLTVITYVNDNQTRLICEVYENTRW